MSVKKLAFARGAGKSMAFYPRARLVKAEPIAARAFMVTMAKFYGASRIAQSEATESRDLVAAE